MNILSLFDGISVAQIALSRTKLMYNNYFAAEIEEYAISVTQSNYPNTIQLGDVTKIDYAQLPKIDLLIGGSPCQGFSIAGKRLGLDDSRSELFFEFVRALKEVNPKYFLLENVVMTKKYQDIVTEHLGVRPILINSALVSGQNRKRLYWTNIPNIEQPKDKQIYLKDIVKKERKWFDILPWSLKEWGGKRKLDTLKFLSDNKSSTITTNKSHPKNYYLNDNKTKMTKLDAEEAEMLQTLPIGYTAAIPEGKRFNALGNSFTADVIAHILSYIEEE